VFWTPVRSEGGQPRAFVRGFSASLALDLCVIEGDDAGRDAEAILGGGREGRRGGEVRQGFVL